jgi:hypothetical protein
MKAAHDLETVMRGEDSFLPGNEPEFFNSPDYLRDPIAPSSPTPYHQPEGMEPHPSVEAAHLPVDLWDYELQGCDVAMRAEAAFLSSFQTDEEIVDKFPEEYYDPSSDECSTAVATRCPSPEVQMSYSHKDVAVNESASRALSPNVKISETYDIDSGYSPEPDSASANQSGDVDSDSETLISSSPSTPCVYQKQKQYFWDVAPSSPSPILPPTIPQFPQIRTPKRAKWQDHSDCEDNVTDVQRSTKKRKFVEDDDEFTPFPKKFKYRNSDLASVSIARTTRNSLSAADAFAQHPFFFERENNNNFDVFSYPNSSPSPSTRTSASDISVRTCKICEKVCNSKGDLKRHMQRRDHSPSAFYCLGCDKSYTRIDALKRHHTVDKDCRRLHAASF